MNNAMNSLLLSLFAGLSTLIGFLFIFIKVKNINKFLSISLSFCACVMFLISIIDLIPMSFFKIIYYFKLLGLVISIIIFLFGILIITFFDYITNFLIEKGSSLYKLGILSAIVLMLHNIPEGIITFLTSGNNIQLGIKIAVAIALHNIPEGICISFPIYYSTKSIKKAFFITFLSGISEFIGAILSYLFLYKFININVLNYVFIFVAGIMINLSIGDIYKESLKYSNNYKNIVFGFLLGIIFFIISLII